MRGSNLRFSITHWKEHGSTCIRFRPPESPVSTPDMDQSHFLMKWDRFFLLIICLRRNGHIHAGMFLSMILHDIFESGLLDTTMWTLTWEGDITTKVDEMPGKDVGNGDLHSLRLGMRTI